MATATILNHKANAVSHFLKVAFNPNHYTDSCNTPLHCTFILISVNQMFHAMLLDGDVAQWLGRRTLAGGLSRSMVDR